MLLEIEKLPSGTVPLPLNHWTTIKNIKSIDIDPLEASSDVFKQTLWRMAATCLSDDGIGLAAPQIGIFKKVIICRELIQNGDKWDIAPTFQVYINPVFEPIIEDLKSVETEFCLSVPNKGYKITRWNGIEVTWQELTTDQIKWETKTIVLKDFPARIFQHEFDHLNGISIPQRWDLQNKKPIKKRKK